MYFTFMWPSSYSSDLNIHMKLLPDSGSISEYNSIGSIIIIDLS